jgi:GntR family transcriptional regulator
MKPFRTARSWTSQEAGSAVSPPEPIVRRRLSLQASDAIRRLITERALRPGDRLPTEAELVALLGVSRGSVREAFKSLEEEGLVEPRHGAGRFLTGLPMVDRPLTRLEGMSEFLLSQGYEVDDRVLELEVVPATTEEQETFALDPGSAIINIERLRFSGELSLTYSSVALPLDLFGEGIQDVDWSQPLMTLLDARGHRITAASARITATQVPERIAKRMGVPAWTPFISLQQRSVTNSGRTVLAATDYYRGDLFSFNVNRRRGP